MSALASDDWQPGMLKGLSCNCPDNCDEVTYTQVIAQLSEQLVNFCWVAFLCFLDTGHIVTRSYLFRQVTKINLQGATGVIQGVN